MYNMGNIIKFYSNIKWSITYESIELLCGTSKTNKSIILLKLTVLHDSHPWLHIRITWEGCDSLGLGWSPLGDSTVGAKVEKHCISTFQLCFDSMVCL